MIIPAVNQIWEVEAGKQVAIVAIQSEDFVGVRQESPIKGRPTASRLVHLAYSDGMTGVYDAESGIGMKDYRLIWCPFGQHKERT